MADVSGIARKEEENESYENSRRTGNGGRRQGQGFQTRCTVFSLLMVVVVCIAFSSSVSVVEAACVSNFTQHSEADLCARYVTYDFFLPTGPTDWIIDALVSYQVNLGTLKLTLLPTECEEKYIAFVCAQTYPKCHTKPDGTVVVEPVCKSICEDVLGSCEGQMEDSALPNCTASGIASTKDCFKVDNNQTVPFPFKCGYPMHEDKKAEPFPCALQCPIPLYSNDVYRLVFWLTMILNPIAFVIIIIFLGIQLYQWKFWCVYPRIYLVYNSAALLITLISFMMAVFEGGFTNATCKSHTERAMGDKPSCTAQHWFLFVGSWMCEGCFMIISVNVLLTFLSKMGKIQLLHHTKKLHIIFHIWLLTPIVIMVVMEALNKTGYGTGIGSCFFAPLPLGGDGVDAAHLFFMVIPLSFDCLIGYICLIITIYLVLREYGMERLKKEFLFVAFPLMYGVPCVLVLVPSWTLVVHGSKMQSSQYLTCKVQNWVTSLFAQYEPVEYQKCIIENGVGRTDYFNYVYGACITGIHFVLLVVFFFGKEARKQFKTPISLKTGRTSSSQKNRSHSKKKNFSLSKSKSKSNPSNSNNTPTQSSQQSNEEA